MKILYFHCKTKQDWKYQDIRAGDAKRINIRLKQKLEQTKPSDGVLPAYVVIVEFSKPIAITAKR